MTDGHRDPLELWVGKWTPEEWITRENRKRETPPFDMKVSEPLSTTETPKRAE